VKSITGAESPLLAFPEFECDGLEAYDKGICLTPKAFIRRKESNSTVPTTATNAKRTVKKHDFLKENFDFAIKGKVFSMNQLSSGYTLQFNVSRVIIKHGFSFRGSLAQIWSQTNYSCFDDGTCTYLEKGKDFVILGHKSGTGKLILGWAWALPRDKHLMDKLKTWKAESKKKKSKD